MLTGLVEPAAEEVALEERLALLRAAERKRSDRLVYNDTEAAPVLEVKNLSIAFPAQHGEVDIVDNVSFSVRPGETMGLVGESGCGKSITSMAVMGLLPSTARMRGEILFKGHNVLDMKLGSPFSFLPGDFRYNGPDIETVLQSECSDTDYSKSSESSDIAEISLFFWVAFSIMLI